MEYSQIKINGIYKLKPNSKVWSIVMQNNVIIDGNIYVIITHTTFNNTTLFGDIIEPNIFGAIRKTEIEFSHTQLEDNIYFDNEKEFNDKLTSHLNYTL